MTRQLPTEAVLGAPLQVRDQDGETIVGIRTADGWLELKRIPE